MILDETVKGGSEAKIRAAFSAIDTHLVHENIISISLDSNIFKQSKNLEKMLKTKAEPNHHAVLIVGRRYNSKTHDCDYLIRNSWGTGCASYSPMLDCDAGHIWLPKSSLKDSITSVISFKNKNINELTPLHLAIREGNNKKAKELIAKSGSSLPTFSKSGKEPLTMAIETGILK